MRTLTLIRIALLTFILCWVGYNQNMDESGLDIANNPGLRNTTAQQLAGLSKKCMRVTEKMSAVRLNERHQDY